MKNQNLPQNPEEDKNLEDIRYFRSNWQNFFDFWKSRGVEADPYKDTILKYPKEKKQKENTLPYQDFGIYDRSSKNKLIESFKQYNEKK